VQGLIERGQGEARAMQSVGYRQIFAAITAGAATSDDALSEAIVRATRIFARRQRTWLRDQAVEWLPAGATKLP